MSKTYKIKIIIKYEFKGQALQFKDEFELGEDTQSLKGYVKTFLEISNNQLAVMGELEEKEYPKYSLESIPFLELITPEGNIKFKNFGEIEELNEWIKHLKKDEFNLVAMYMESDPNSTLKQAVNYTRKILTQKGMDEKV